MKQATHLIALSALAASTLSGCASAGDRYPSLAVRDAERSQGTLAATAPDAPSVIAAPDMEPIFAALEKAREANAQFMAQQSNVRDLVGATGTGGLESDRRARALVGLASLTSLRSQTATALGDLDLLEVKAATTFSRTAEIRQTQAEILRLIEAQDDTLDSLSSALNP